MTTALGVSEKTLGARPAGLGRVCQSVAFYELLGYIVADGCFTSDRLCVADKDRENLEIYSRKFAEAFSRPARIKRGLVPHEEIRYPLEEGVPVEIVVDAGFCDAAKTSPDVKLLPLAWKDGAPFATPTYDDVRAGHYPLAVHLRLYAVRKPGAPLDPLVKEYARLVLSREGQAIIAAEKDGDEAFIPLNDAEVAAELGSLE